jgi:thioredoxin-like negative regulator of GroEL
MQLLKFQADWCAPCHTLTKVMTDIPHHPINIDTLEGMVLAKKMQVQSIPTLVLLDDEGAEIARITGLVPRDKIELMLKENDDK